MAAVIRGAAGTVLLIQEHSKTMHSQTDLVVGVDEHCALATARPHGEQVCQQPEELVHLLDAWRGSPLGFDTSPTKAYEQQCMNNQSGCVHLKLILFTPTSVQACR